MGTSDDYPTDKLEQELRKFIRIDIKEADPEIRLMNLFADYDSFLLRRNLSELSKKDEAVCTTSLFFTETGCIEEQRRVRFETKFVLHTKGLDGVLSTRF